MGRSRNLGPEPQGPIDAILTTEEPTYEGLVKALMFGWPSIGIFSDEGGRFLGGHDMNSDNQLKTASGLSKLWDGDAITRTRGGDGNFLIYGRRVSVHLMVQPIVSDLLFGNDILSGQGFLSRCLVACPPSKIGHRPYNSTSLQKTPKMCRYFGRMMEILETPLPLTEITRNELAPRNLQLSSEAKSIWVKFHDHIEVLSREDRELFPIKGLAAKSAEHAARLAGILALVEI